MKNLNNGKSDVTISELINDLHSGKIFRFMICINYEFMTCHVIILMVNKVITIIIPFFELLEEV